MESQPPPPPLFQRQTGPIWPPSGTTSTSNGEPIIDKNFADFIQQAIRTRDIHSQTLLQTKQPGVVPLPPPQFHIHQRETPYRPVLPPLLDEGDPDQQQLIHTRWLTTTLYTLSGAMAALAQSILVHQERAHKRACDRKAGTNGPHEDHQREQGAPTPQPRTQDGGPDGSPGTEDALRDTQAEPISPACQREEHADTHGQKDSEDTGPGIDEEGDLLLATCAEHMRHVAKTSQQLMAALSVHIDATRNKQRAHTPTTSTPLARKEDC